MNARLRPPRESRGLTLIELVVVLTILTALGGLLVPVITNMVGRTHNAKCSTVIPELTNAFVRSYAMDLRYPDGYDSLLNTDGTSLFTKNPGGPTVSGELTTTTLDANAAAALSALGIRTVIDLDDSIPGDATWQVSDLVNSSAVARTLSAGSTAAMLNLAGNSVVSLNLKRHLTDPTTRYLVFGVGNNCTAVGPNGHFVEAPTHFGGEDVMNPKNVYQRYCVIFSIAGDPASASPDYKVNFECACSVHPDGFDGAEAHIRNFWDDTQR